MRYLNGIPLVFAAALGGSSLGLWASQPTARAPAAESSSVPQAPVLGCAAGQPTVSVQGYGAAEGPPDQMTLWLGAHTDAPSAEAALSENAARAQALVEVLSAAGVPSAQVQTSNLSVQPNYNENGQVSGYQVDDDLTVTLIGGAELAKAGQVIDDAGRAAGDALRVDGISFSLSDSSPLFAEAREKAVRQARALAAAMAAAAGESLGPLCSLRDESQSATPPPWALLGAAAPATVRTPVEPGSEQVSAQVSAVFALWAPPLLPEGSYLGGHRAVGRLSGARGVPG